MTLELGSRGYEQALWELAADDDRLVVMTAENRAPIRGLEGRLGPRFIDTGITEQTLVGAAAGLAMRGRVPVVHALAAFLTMRAFEFCRTDVGLLGLPVKLIGFIPGLLSDGNGPTHQAIEDIGLMRLIPGMRIFAPADTHDLVAALPVIISDAHPWYVRWIDRPSPLDHAPFVPGSSETLRTGPDLTILTYGYLVPQSLRVAEELARHGLEATVVHMRSLVPVDGDAIAAALGSPLCVTIEDHLATGGLASIVSEIALGLRRPGKLLGIHLQGPFPPCQPEEVLTAAGFDTDRLVRRIIDARAEAPR